MEFTDRLYTVAGGDEVSTAVAKTAAATKTILVLDNAGTPLPGAHVYGTTGIGTTTDFDGRATIQDSGELVTISYMGFANRTFSFDSLPETVQLTPAENQLEEVVIIGKNKSYFWPALGIGTALLIAIAANNKEKPEPQPKPVTL